MSHYPASIEQRTQQARDAMSQLKQRLHQHIEVVRQFPRPDMITTLVNARNENVFLNDDELIANVIGLVNAGQETTACLLANGLYRYWNIPNRWNCCAKRQN